MEIFGDEAGWQVRTSSTSISISTSTAASTTIGIAVGSNIAKNSVIIPSANNSTSSDDNIPSPDDSFINSVLETGDYPDISPLENLLGYQLTLNILIFIILIIILFIIFNRYILKYNINFLF